MVRVVNALDIIIIIDIITASKSTGITSWTIKIYGGCHMCRTFVVYSITAEVGTKWWILQGLNYCLLGEIAL